MKNACYCTLLAAALLVSCQTAPKGPAAASTAPSTAPTTDASGAAPTDQVPADTVLWVRLGKDLDSTRLKAGDHFSAEVSSPIVLNGKAVVPQGTPVQGVVEEAHTAEHTGSSGRLALRVVSLRLGLRSFPVQTGTVDLESPQVRANKAGGTSEADRMARREGDAFVPRGENLQFVITAPVNFR